jgi:hypothetical protein
MSNTPWIGLAAVIAMFLLPFLPEWLFEGPRKVKHWPRQDVCGSCDEPWTDGHACTSIGREDSASLPLSGTLRRTYEGSAIGSKRLMRNSSLDLFVIDKE